MTNWPPTGFPLPPVPIELPPPAPRPRLGIRAVAAWVAIVVAAAGMIQLNTITRSIAQTTTHSSDLQLDLVCRYTVGVKLLLSGTPMLSSANLADMASQVREKATSPLDQLKSIPVIAELQGNDAAASEAEKLLSRTSDGAIVSDAKALRKAYSPKSTPLDAATVQHLEEQYGWYGQLAASQVGPSPGDARATVEAQAKRTAATFLSAMGIAIPVLIAGLVLLVIFIIKWSGGTMPPRYAQGDPAAADTLAEGFAVYLCLMAALMGSVFLIRYLPRRPGPVWNALLLLPIVAALGWVRFRGLSMRQLGQAVGWNAGSGIAQEMFAGIVGYIAGTPLIVMSIFLFAFLQKFAGTAPSHPIEFDIESGGWERAMLFFLACVFAPIAEELMFRGMLLRHLTARMSWLVSAVIVSIVFAAVHPQGWTAIPVLATIGMVLALIRVQRDTLVASMTAHALNNFLIITLLVIAVS